MRIPYETLSMAALTAILVLGCTDSETNPTPADATTGTDGTDATDGTDGSDGTDNTAGTDGTNGTDGTEGTDGTDGTTGTARWDRPAGSAAVTFYADDTENGTYSDGQIRWTGSFAWDKATNTIEYASSWLPDEREWPLLYDDGPISAGGHEAEGEQAGDGIFSTEVFVTATEESVFEFGALNEFNRWIWIGPNGQVTVPAGSEDRIDAGGVTFPAFGDRDLDLTIDVNALNEEFATITPETHNIFVKGTMNSWTPVQLLDNGNDGDETAGDGVYTYRHSTRLGDHDGLVAPGQHVQFVFVFAFKDALSPDDGLEYKFPVDALTDGVAARSGKDGEFVDEAVILEPDSYGKVQNTTVVISGTIDPPPECDDENPCTAPEICVSGKCVADTGDAPTVSLVDPAGGAASGGTPVVVSGTNFVDGATVWFGDNAATDVVFKTAGTIECTTPAGTIGPVTVRVQNPDGAEGSYPGGFNYTDKPAPTIAAVSPTEGPVKGGDTVEVTGTGFQPGATVFFGLAQASSVSVATAGTSLTCTSPVGSVGLVDVTVTNPDGQSVTRVAAFTYVWGAVEFVLLEAPTSLTVDAGQTAGPVYARAYHQGATEAEGPASDMVVDLGWGAPGSDPAGGTWTWTAAAFHGQGGDFGNDDVWTASFPVIEPGTYDFAFRFTLDGTTWVYADADASTTVYSAGQSGTLTVTAPPEGLQVFGLSPASGAVDGGTVVTITGQDFTASAAVSFGGVAATSVNVLDAGTLEATTPAHAAGSVTVTVTVGDDSADAPQSFTFGQTQVTPTIDGEVPGDWPAASLLADDTATTGWDFNDLDHLYMGYDADNLYLGIKGSVEAGNVLVVFIDTDFGQSTGHVPSTISDNAGALDSALSGPGVAVDVTGFGAEYAIGAFGGTSVSSPDLNEAAGLRQLANGGDLGWFAADVVWGATGVEMRIPLATLGLQPTDGGHEVAVFARIVNNLGDTASPEGLPTSSAGDGSVNEVVTLWVP